MKEIYVIKIGKTTLFVEATSKEDVLVKVGANKSEDIKIIDILPVDKFLGNESLYQRMYA